MYFCKLTITYQVLESLQFYQRIDMCLSQHALDLPKDKSSDCRHYPSLGRSLDCTPCRVWKHLLWMSSL